jgi:hypothetical protein
MNFETNAYNFSFIVGKIQPEKAIVVVIGPIEFVIRLTPQLHNSTVGSDFIQSKTEIVVQVKFAFPVVP